MQPVRRSVVLITINERRRNAANIQSYKIDQRDNYFSVELKVNMTLKHKQKRAFYFQE